MTIRNKPAKRMKQREPKLWHSRVIAGHARKQRVRKHWTRTRWLAYHAARDLRRNAEPRAGLKIIRLTLAARALAEQHAADKRRAAAIRRAETRARQKAAAASSG